MKKLFCIVLLLFACTEFFPVSVKKNVDLIGSWQHDKVGIIFNINHQFNRFNVSGDTIFGSTWQMNNDTVVISSNKLIIKYASRTKLDTVQSKDTTGFIFSINSSTLTLCSFHQNNQCYYYEKCN